jgi:hypothetical protein
VHLPEPVLRNWLVTSPNTLKAEAPHQQRKCESTPERVERTCWIQFAPRLPLHRGVVVSSQDIGLIRSSGVAYVNCISEIGTKNNGDMEHGQASGRPARWGVLSNIVLKARLGPYQTANCSGRNGLVRYSSTAPYAVRRTLDQMALYRRRKRNAIPHKEVSHPELPRLERFSWELGRTLPRIWRCKGMPPRISIGLMETLFGQVSVDGTVLVRCTSDTWCQAHRPSTVFRSVGKRRSTPRG